MASPLRHPTTRYYFEITELLNTVPREMLLLLKMNDCLRHIDRELGAPVNTSCVQMLIRQTDRQQ